MNEWTVATLKEHFDAMLVALDLRLQQRFEAGERRLDGMNEFRESLDDAQKTYITRLEAMAAIGRNEADIKAVTDRVNVSSGRGSGFKDMWGVITGAVAIAIALYAALRSR